MNLRCHNREKISSSPMDSVLCVSISIPVVCSVVPSDNRKDERNPRGGSSHAETRGGKPPRLEISRSDSDKASINTLIKVSSSVRRSPILLWSE